MKTAKEFYNYHNKIWQETPNDNAKNRILNMLEEYAELRVKEALDKKNEYKEIVKKLANWSRKYPRGRIYPMNKISMDDELIEIENLAKEVLPNKPKDE